MKVLSKSLLGAGAAAAALVSTAAPAEAQYRHRDRDGISAGEVIAGAVILGGLAAVLSAGKNARYQDDYNRDDYSRDNYNTNNSGSRAAVNKCINQVENRAGGYSRSNVTHIRGIERTRYGYRVQGILSGQNDSRGNDRYDRGDGYGENYRYDQGSRYDEKQRYDGNRYGNGYNARDEGGQFTCYVERGRVVDIDYNGPIRWN